MSDLILLVGTNPRFEATMLNARIRKVFAQKRIPIFSIGDPGELTYGYTIIGNKQMIFREYLIMKQNFQKNYYLRKTYCNNRRVSFSS